MEWLTWFQQNWHIVAIVLGLITVGNWKEISEYLPVLKGLFTPRQNTHLADLKRETKECAEFLVMAEIAGLTVEQAQAVSAYCKTLKGESPDA